MESNGLSPLYMYQIYQKVRLRFLESIKLFLHRILIERNLYYTPQARININLLNRVNIDL